MLAVAMMVATISASAQVYVGGGINFHTIDDGSDNNKTVIGIRPEVGYKLDDKLSIGIALGYNSTKQGDVKSSDWSIAPYARYTFAKWNNVGFFGEAEFAYGHSEDKYDAGSASLTTNKYNAWSLGVRPGISIDVTKNLTFLTKIGWLGYKSKKLDADGAKATNDFGLDLSGEDIQFSLVYNF